MANLKLKAHPREIQGTRVRHLRRDGKVPAVLYGKGETSVPLVVDQLELEAAIRTKARMMDLDVGGKTHTIFLKEVQRDALSDEYLHVDFQKVRMDQVLRTKVALRLKGIAAGIAEGGVVNQIFHEITIECLPADLPEGVECVITQIKLDEVVHLKDLVLPARVKVIGDPETVVISVQKPKEEVAAAAGAEGEAKQPELIRKEKEKADGEEGDEKAEKGDKKAADKDGEKKTEPATKGAKPEGKK